jgi:hypothetical protein
MDCGTLKLTGQKYLANRWGYLLGPNSDFVRVNSMATYLEAGLGFLMGLTLDCETVKMTGKLCWVTGLDFLMA